MTVELMRWLSGKSVSDFNVPIFLIASGFVCFLLLKKSGGAGK